MSTQHQAQHLPKEHLLRDLHTIQIILATENKVSLAEKSQRLKSSNLLEWISKSHLQHIIKLIRRNSLLAEISWQKQILQSKADSLFVFRNLSSFGGSSASEVPELLHCSMH